MYSHIHPGLGGGGSSGSYLPIGGGPGGVHGLGGPSYFEE
jgi:hypothetical protein